MIQAKRRNSRKQGKFKPNRAFVAKATEFFIAHGGRITRIEADEQSFENSWMINDVARDVDEFLGGG